MTTEPTAGPCQATLVLLADDEANDVRVYCQLPTGHPGSHHDPVTSRTWLPPVFAFIDPLAITPESE